MSESNSSNETQDDIEPFPLGKLDTVKLTWEDKDGNTQEQRFDEDHTQEKQDEAGTSGLEDTISIDDKPTFW